MRVVTLIENLVYKEGLVAEHGLSLFFDTGTRKILFDTGQTGAFLENARKLGIDLKQIDSVVISHGHYDHTGGLKEFLKMNSHAEVYAKSGIFTMKYSGFDRYIGIPVDIVVPRKRLTIVEKPTELDNGFFIVPEIPVLNLNDTQFGNFFVKKGNGLVPDEFDDELFIAHVSGGKVSVFSSCSHRGISNILSEAGRLFGLPIGTVMGGFHMMAADEEHQNLVSSFLAHANLVQVGICHCSGIGTYTKLKSELSCPVFYSMTGNGITI